VALGTSEGKGEEYRAQSQAVAGLCRSAGADEDLILGWIEEGRRRAEAASLPPFSRPGRAPPRQTASGRGLVTRQPTQDGPEPQTWQ
jgi:hypothetical protein